MSLSRRDLGKLLAGGALRAALPAGVIDLDAAERVAKILNSPRRVDPQVLDYFRTLLEQHFTAGNGFGRRVLRRMPSAFSRGGIWTLSGAVRRSRGGLRT